MESMAEIKNRSVEISTELYREDYCRTAVLFYILEGSSEFEFDNRKVKLQESDILVINRGTEYTLRGCGNFMLASLELMGKTFESACDGVNVCVNCNSCENKSEYYSRLRSLLKRMILNQFYVEEDGNKYSYLAFEYYSLYYKLLETIIAYFVTGDPESLAEGEAWGKNEERRRMIERYLNIHYMEPISLEDMAQKLYLSKGYLSRFFIQCFGVTFSQYLKEIRLKHAMSELQYTDKPVTQIALDNGFSGSSFFNRTFREKFKMNPTEVRNEFKRKKQFADEEESVDSGQREKIQERAKKLLDMSDEPAVTEEQKNRYCFSVEAAEKFHHCWSSVINVGSASEVLRTDVQAHIMVLSRYFIYARFWDPFSEDMLLDVNRSQGNYNFLRLDQVLDSLLNCGMKPFIVFEPKLERVNEGVDSMVVKAAHNTIIENVLTWKNIIHAFIRHIIQKYGLEEVEQWKFELTYGVYELRGMEPKDSYLELFKTMADCVREYTDKLMLGGPSLPSCETEILKDLLKGMREKGCMPDYLSMISFAYEVNEQIRKYSRRSIDEEFLLKDVKKYRRAMSESGFENVPLYITEWNETVADRNFVNDSCYRGAYIVKNLLEINPYVSAVGYFCGTDLRAEYFDSGSLLQGGNGIISRDGIFKPAGFAVELMNMLADYRIGSRKQFLITTDRRDNYYIIAHNKRKLSYFYYKTPEEKIEKEKLSRYCEDEESAELVIDLVDIKNGEYGIRMHKVNSRYGSILDLWRELNYSEQLSRKDIMYLQRICEPHLRFSSREVRENRLSLKVVMEANEFVLIEVKRNI